VWGSDTVEDKACQGGWMGQSPQGLGAGEGALPSLVWCWLTPQHDPGILLPPLTELWRREGA